MKFRLGDFEVDIKARKMATVFPEKRANKKDLDELLSLLWVMAYDAKENEEKTWGHATTISRKYCGIAHDISNARKEA